REGGAVLGQAGGDRMIANDEPRKRAAAIRLHDVQAVVRVVEGVENATIRRNPEPRDGSAVLAGSEERIADARPFPAFFVPAVVVLNVGTRVSGAARDVDALSVSREGETAPGLLHRERGDLLFGREI